MLQIFFMYIVISVIGNFHVKTFSPLVLQTRVKQKLNYERTNYTM